MEMEFKEPEPNSRRFSPFMAPLLRHADQIEPFTMEHGGSKYDVEVPESERIEIISSWDKSYMLKIVVTWVGDIVSETIAD